MIGKTISHYKILEKLGEGGMGVVYKAEDTKLKREVAIKFLPHHIAANEEERQRFEIEAQAAASLNHPNISTIHSIEEVNNDIFIVMEYIDGEELKDKIKKDPISIDEAINISTQIAEGLEAAHNKGIVHRDIKSGNIMITKGGKIKIMDFGLAKVGTSHITKVGLTIGTTAYMSPEQARSDNVDYRTDIWSMGVILYEMLAGKLPFCGDFEQAVIYSILNEEPESISSIKKDIPIKLEQIIQKILNKNPNLRYQSAEELLKEIKGLQNKTGGQPKSDMEKTIAVLPFENISPDKETDYFADGLAEELIINLSRIKEVSVIARTNSMRYKGSNKDIGTIGRELEVRYILTGSVRKFQDNLRITAQLIDVETDEQLWVGTYKGTLADVFDIQEQVSKQIVDALMVKLSPTEKVVLTKRPTLNHEAFDCYLRARDFLYHFNKNSLSFSIKLFQKAIELDPRYADAYAGLAHSYAAGYQFIERNETLLDKAIELSLKALMYDNSLPEAYDSLSLAYYNKGQFDEGITASKKAIELDQNNFLGYWMLGRIYVAIDKTKEAVDNFNKVTELNPDFYSVYGDLQIAYAQLGDKEKYKETLFIGLIAYERYLSQHPDDPRAHMYFATDLAQVGKIEEAKIEANKALELSPGDPLMLYNAGCFYAQMGEKKLAIDSIRNAIATGYAEFEWLKRDSDLESIRNEPEFLELIKGK